MKATRRTPSSGRIASLLLIVVMTATGLLAAPKKEKGKSFGHKPDPVTVGGRGQGRLTGPNHGRKAREVAADFARQSKEQLGLTDSDLAILKLKDEYRDRHNGVTHVYLQQEIAGIEVADSALATHLTRDLEVISVSSTLVHGVADADQSPATLSAADAVAAAAREVELELTEVLEVVSTVDGPQRQTTLTGGGIASDPIEARLVYQPVAEGGVRLAWNVEIQETGGEHWWSIAVDAKSGEVIAGDDFTDHDNWNGVVPDVARNKTLSRTVATAAVLRPDVQSSVMDGSGYNVYPQPFESPNDGPATFVMNPAESLASPFGWHDTNAVAGPEFTRTRGNNVHAYTDVDENNQVDSGSDPDGGPSLQFNFVFNPLLSPALNRPSAVVNLFYWNNIVHDVFYQYGFDEISGNFQVHNYGRGPVNAANVGVGHNDDVRAEAQDGSGTNNANFSTGADGARPRMQMYVWSYPFSNVVQVATPSPAAGTYIAAGATFGPLIGGAGLSGEVVLGVDAVTADGPSPTDGCTAFLNNVAGKIVLVDRGTCVFTVKVKNAQDAGALAVIVGNNSPLDPSSMGFTAPIPVITIPSVMVSQVAATLFKVNVPFAASVTLNPGPPPNRDSDFDAGVIAHEYGHGISNRLTGGRTVQGCVAGQEQMGEGWSDFLGLVLTTNPADTAAMPRGIGTYLLFQTPLGNGIRPTPYSTDMAINPSTYNTIRTAAQPHGVGYVWATMLWEMYWNLVQKHGYNANVYAPWNTGGNNLGIQLVFDGMKLQPCRPGFVAGRDAILQADQELTGGQNQCEIWRAFAKRGLGIGAVQGSSNNVLDGVESFVSDDGVPVISNLSASLTSIWPPNHKMVDVSLSYDVADMCGVTKTITVSSNEPEGSSEKDDVVGDWEVIGSNLVRLRAERLGTGDGRIYTITVTATDGAGNSSSASVTVSVPKDQR